MQLYNTLSRKKEEFIPARPGRVHIYVCGITAYDYCHIGHARSAIVFDVLVRHLRKMGLDVFYVRNFTDIDDKIIKRANEEKLNWHEVAQTYITAFHEDMEKLDVVKADFEPRATENIGNIIMLCQKLLSRDMAYLTSSGDVYFRVRSLDDYGKLSGRSLDEMRAGARVIPEEEKEDPLDFALWKSAKPGEPEWDSPFGKGRPGWHIECSAMTQPYLPLDIHGGGQDLIFPHHENEIAQTESACGCKLANYWMHNGFVQINSEKMSKSLGNFTTIREILKYFLPETLRFFLLTKHYRSPLDFSNKGMEEAEKGQKRIYGALREAQIALSQNNWKDKPFPAEILNEWQLLKEQFEDALDDDLNTGKALGHIFSQTRIINRILEDKNMRKAREAGNIMEDFIGISHNWHAQLGLFGEEPEKFLHNLRNIQAARLNLDVSNIEALLQERTEAKKTKNYIKADQLRNQLAEGGILIRDTLNGSVWDIDMENRINHP